MHWLSCRSHWTLTSYSFYASCVSLLLCYIFQPTSGERQGRGYMWREVPLFSNEQSHGLPFIPQLQWMVHGMYVWNPRRIVVCVRSWFLWLFFVFVVMHSEMKTAKQTIFGVSFPSQPCFCSLIFHRGIETLQCLGSFNFSSFHKTSD